MSEQETPKYVVPRLPQRTPPPESKTHLTKDDIDLIKGVANLRNERDSLQQQLATAQAEVERLKGEQLPFLNGRFKIISEEMINALAAIDSLSGKLTSYRECAKELALQLKCETEHHGYERSCVSKALAKFEQLENGQP